MKKINKFWKVYIFTVTVVVLVGSIALGVIYIALGRYENTARESNEVEESLRAAESLAAAESSAAAQAAAELEAREELERESLQRLQELLASKAALSALGTLRAQLTVAAGNASADKAVASLVSRLNAGGISELAGLSVNTVSRYEAPGALVKYLSSLGTYSYVLTSGFSAELYAGGSLAATLTLAQAELSEFGFACYKPVSAVCVLPELAFTVTSPHASELFVNGYAVSEADRTYTDSKFDSIPEKYGVPQTDEFVLSGFIFTPELSAEVTSDGDKVGLTAEHSGSSVAFLPPENAAYKAALTERAILTATKYGDFVAGDIEFSDLKPYLLRGTPLYSTLAGYNNDWYFGHSSMDNTDMHLVKFIVYSDTLVYARVQYRQVLYNAGGGVLRRVDIDFEIYMVCTGQPDIPDPDMEETAPDTASGTAASAEESTDTPPDSAEDRSYADWVAAALYSN